jgi:hypothetical protein
MKIIVAIPSISYDMALKLAPEGLIGDVISFSPTGYTLDVFYNELKNVKVPDLFGINIPCWPLKEKGSRGVYGPGGDSDELFHPSDLEKRFAMIGNYDRWRPYPAKAPLSTYSENLAKRYLHKRGKMFTKAAHDLPWEVLFYAEHAPASLAHLDSKVAQSLAKKIIDTAMTVYRSMPYVKIVIFSPFGARKKPGFVVSNQTNDITNWDDIRAFLTEKK